MEQQATAPYARNFFDDAADFVHAKLADFCDLLVLGVLLICVAVAAAGPSFFLTRNVLAASLVAPAVCYLLVSRSLRKSAQVGYERIFVALAVAAAGAWLFETIAHYSWLESWELLGESLVTFNINPVGRDKPFPILWAVIMVAAMFVGHKHMRVTRWFAIALAAVVVVLVLWLAVGHPSHDQPWRSPDGDPIIDLIPTYFAHPSTPADPGWAFIVFWGGLLASALKIVVAVLPATLFLHLLDARTPAVRPDDLLARARTAVAAGLAPVVGPRRPALREVPRIIRDLMIRARRDVGMWLPDLADLAMVVVILFCVAASVVSGSFILTDKVLSASIIGFALSFLIASRSLRKRKELGIQRMFIGLCALVSSVWLFEIVWRLWGFDTWNLIRDQLFTLSFASPWPMGWALLMVSLVFVGVQYMGVNRWFLLTLAMAVATFWVWKEAGFPQFPHPEWWPSKNPTLPFIAIEFSHPTNARGQEAVAWWGAFLNSLTKIFWCALPGTLFLTRANIGAPKRAPWKIPWPALASILMPWREWRAAAAPSAGPGAAPAPVEPVVPAAGPKPESDTSARPSARNYPNLGDHLKHLVRDKLADYADLFMVGVIVGVLGVAIVNNVFTITGRVLATSIAVYAFCYLVASRRLRAAEGVGFERMFIAACAMVAGIWLFEVLAHFGWIVSWDLLGRSVTDFNIRPPALREPFPLMWTAIMVSVAFVGARWMKVNRWFLLALGAGAAVFALWLAVGYPSFTDPWRSPQGTEVIQLIPPELRHPRTTASPGWDYIAFWGAIFNAVAKLCICVLPAALYLHKSTKLKPSGGRPPDDVLLHAWKGIGRAVALVRLQSGADEEPTDAPEASNSTKS